MWQMLRKYCAIAIIFSLYVLYIYVNISVTNVVNVLSENCLINFDLVYVNFVNSCGLTYIYMFS